MTKRAWTRVAYGLLAILNLMLVATYGEIQAGRVPFPPDMSYLAPIISAGLVGATALLPRVQDVQARD